MLTYLRTHMKTIMLVVAVIFAASMFYGLGTGIRSGFGGQRKVSGFLKVNGQKVNPMRYKQVLLQIRQNFPEQISPQEALFLQNMALSQTIDLVECDLVISATPIDLGRLIPSHKKILRVTYDMEEMGTPDLEHILKDY